MRSALFFLYCLDCNPNEYELIGTISNNIDNANEKRCAIVVVFPQRSNIYLFGDDSN